MLLDVDGKKKLLFSFSVLVDDDDDDDEFDEMLNDQDDDHDDDHDEHLEPNCPDNLVLPQNLTELSDLFEKSGIIRGMKDIILKLFEFIYLIYLKIR